MNYLKTALRVQLGFTNPYQIKPQYKILSTNHPFNSSPTQTTFTSKLIAKDKIDNDYYILRFSLPQQDKCLGINIGQYIWIQLKDKNKRPYVPISRIDQTGFVDILVRDMSAKNKGSFTQKLLNLPIQASVNIVGPGTQFIYEGYGKFKYVNQEQNINQQTKQSKNINTQEKHPYYPHATTNAYLSSNSKQAKIISKTFKNIGIITHSSAITTTYSLIQSIATNYDNKTGISLLWLGDKQSDFVFINQLTNYVERCQLNMNLMLSGVNQINKNTKNWLGPYGKVMQKHIQDYMPFPGSKQIILMSGLEGELEQVPSLIKKMGYTDYLNF